MDSQPRRLFPSISGWFLTHRLQERGGHHPDVGVGVLAEGRRLGPGRGGTEQAHLANRGWVAEEQAGEVDEVFDVEILDSDVTHRDVGGPRHARP